MPVRWWAVGVVQRLTSASHALRRTRTHTHTHMHAQPRAGASRPAFSAVEPRIRVSTPRRADSRGERDGSGTTVWLLHNSLAWWRTEVVRLPLRLPAGTSWGDLQVCVSQASPPPSASAPTPDSPPPGAAASGNKGGRVPGHAAGTVPVPAQVHVVLGGNPDAPGQVQVSGRGRVTPESFGAEIAVLARVPPLGVATVFVTVTATAGGSATAPSCDAGPRAAARLVTAAVHVVKGGRVRRPRAGTAGASGGVGMRGARPGSPAGAGAGAAGEPRLRFVATATPGVVEGGSEATTRREPTGTPGSDSGPAGVQLRNGCVTVTVDAVTGLLSGMATRSSGGHALSLQQRYAKYQCVAAARAALAVVVVVPVAWAFA